MIDEHVIGTKDETILKIRGVQKGDKVVRLVSYCGFVAVEAPEDGFIVKLEEGPASVPLYFRLSDLQMAMDVRAKNGKPVELEVHPW